IARNRLSGEFEPLVKEVNLQLNCFEKGLVKEMKDDLNYVTSLDDEFDEKSLILDIQKEFFKTRFESVKSESHSHVYENEIFEQDSSLENDNCCLKKTIYELSKQVDDVKDEMTKRCAQYEKDFAKPEAHCISLKLKSQNKSLTSVQNGQVLSNKSNEAKIKFDTEDLETINIELEYSAYEVVKAFYLDVIHLQFQMEECHKILTERVDWANPKGDQGSCHALLISKMKAASYPDFGLDLLVPEQMWIDDVCTYEVSAKYGISYWWFTRQKFYIDRHDSPSRRKEVRTHMQILSVVRIKAYSRYGYDYLSEIVLQRADHQERKIAKKDFKNLYLLASIY
ncbi:hypothetical protein Tco_1289851, partial [Tanacetum coccineum]